MIFSFNFGLVCIYYIFIVIKIFEIKVKNIEGGVAGVFFGSKWNRNFKLKLKVILSMFLFNGIIYSEVFYDFEFFVWVEGGLGFWCYLNCFVYFGCIISNVIVVLFMFVF